MTILLIIIGGLLGAWLGEGGNEPLGFWTGAGIGFLIAQLRTLRSQVDRLEDRVHRLAGKRRVEEEPVVAPPRAGPEPVMARKAAHEPAPRAVREIDRPAEAIRGAFAEAVRREDRGPDLPERLWQLAKDWITTGNVPVKLGVIVSFFGVAFLLKYAVDKRILVLSIEMRLILVAIAAGVLLTIGWRLREKARVYALSLQGGGFGILYLTIFSAFRLYQLLPASVAFVLLVLLIAAAGMLAVLQEAKALAILGSVGGFLAPVLVTTGAGNHVALFSYYLLLNAAILGIAWYRAWRGLNLIGFAFTFGVGTLWGYEYYRPALFASTEPFLVLYFLFYQAIAILYAFRQPPDLRGLVDGTIIFGTPAIAFALQTELVGDTEYGIAISAAALAAFYVGIALWLRRWHGEQMRLLGDSFIALGVAFGTIAIPLALDDRWTAVAWALEGAALVWIGARQQGVLAKLSGAALLIASGIAYLQYGWTRELGIPLINGNVLGGLLVSVSSLFGARWLTADAHARNWQPFVAVPLLLWGLAWWLGTGSAEIDDRLDTDLELHLTTIFVAVSTALFAWIASRCRWIALRRTMLAFLPALPFGALLYLLYHGHFFAGAGMLAWPAAFAAHFYVLRQYEDAGWRIEGVWHYAGVLLLAGIVAFEVWWRVDQASFSEVWSASAGLSVAALATLLILLVRDYLSWPVRRYWPAYLLAAGTLIDIQLLAVGLIGIANPGDPAPLAYLPMLNPFDVITIAGLVVGLHCLMTIRNTTDWLGPDRFRAAAGVWGIVAFLLTTIAVVRGVHHLADVPWDERALSRSVSVQAALSIYWALLAFAGMILGARRGDRWLWLGGTALMGAVVLKLFLVDLGNTGTVARIVSFLGVGALLLVVGYFAPAPPRRQE